MADKREKSENTHKQQVAEGDTLLAVGACNLRITRRVECGKMSELKIRIETDEWTYEEYIEA